MCLLEDIENCLSFSNIALYCTIGTRYTVMHKPFEFTVIMIKFILKTFSHTTKLHMQHNINCNIYTHSVQG